MDVDWNGGDDMGDSGSPLGADSPDNPGNGASQGDGAKVEHPFLKTKRMFGYARVRDRGLAKNTQRLALLLGLGNLLTVEGRQAA